jgi:polysaccharide pyruvyl transferase WcaK-like protein
VKEKLRKTKSQGRIALLTPYTGGNFGDAAIQDAVVANLRRELPDIEFSGITLNNENFLRLHGTKAFPLVGAGATFFQMETKQPPEFDVASRNIAPTGKMRTILRLLPGARRIKHRLKACLLRVKAIYNEARHWIQGYRFIRTHDMLLFSGGGQLDDNYGGPWGLPYALLKWTLLARLARVQCVMASVGVGIINSPLSRQFLSAALRLCVYRSFREVASREAASKLLHRTINDPVVPDFALSLTESELPDGDVTIRARAGDLPVIVLSPMAFAKPHHWPAPDRELHDRYVQQMAIVLAELYRRNYFVVIACSSRGDDESVIPEILELLDQSNTGSLRSTLYVPRVDGWKTFISIAKEADYMIASRLHGTIFGFLAKIPVVAVSFASKVDWILEYLEQRENRLDIRNFTAEDVIAMVERFKVNSPALVAQITSRRQRILSEATGATQFAILARLAGGAK